MMLLAASAVFFTDIWLAWEPPDSSPEPVKYYEVLISVQGEAGVFPLGWKRLVRTKTNETMVYFIAYPLTNKMECIVRACYETLGASQPSNKIVLDPALYEPTKFRLRYPEEKAQLPAVNTSRLRAGSTPIRRPALPPQSEAEYRRALAVSLSAPSRDPSQRLPIAR